MNPSHSQRIDPLEFLFRSPIVGNVPAEIRERFVTARVEPAGTEGQFAARAKLVPLLSPDPYDLDAVRVPVGLVPAVRAACADAGVPVSGLPGIGTWAVQRGTCPLAPAVASRRTTLVAHPPGFDVGAAVIGLCRAFPGRRIVIPVARKTEAHALVSALNSARVRAELALGGATVRGGDCRVWVATLRGLMTPQVEPHRADLMISPDAREVNSALGWEAIAQAPRARRVGFVSAEVRPSPYDRDTLAVLFGTERVRVAVDGQPLRPVRVLSVPFTGPGIPTLRNDPLDVLRVGVWENPVRNRRLVALAKLLAAGAEPELASRFPAAVPPTAPGSARKVAILAGTPSHARALHKGLSDRSNLAAPKALDIPVVTPDDLAAVLPDVDVVVRADAGVGLPAGLALDAPDRACGDLLVVDAIDRHHPDLRRRSRSRVLAYANAGFAIGRDDEAGLAGFLLTRPRGT